MSSMKSAILAAVVVAAVLWNGVAAQSGCTVALMSLSPCLNYVSGNTSSPSTPCCSSLSSVVGSQPQCLCTLLKGGGANLGITVNQTLAVALPGACKVQTPPLSRCDAVNGPSSAPAPAAADAPTGSTIGEDTPDATSTPDVPSSGAGAGAGGSKTVPGTDGSANSGSNVGSSLSVVGGFVLMVASSSWLLS